MRKRCGQWIRRCRPSSDQSEEEFKLKDDGDMKIMSKNERVMRVLLLGPTLSGKSSFLASIMEGGDFLNNCVPPTRGFLYNTQLCKPFQNLISVIELGGTAKPALLSISGPCLVDAIGLFFDGSLASSIETMLYIWWKEAFELLTHASATGNQPFFFVVESHVDQATPLYIARIQHYIQQDTGARFLYSGFQTNNADKCRAFWHVLLRQFKEQCKTLPLSSV